MIGPVGNVATEKPKSKIMAEEFDILFGVKASDLPSKSKDKRNARGRLDGDGDAHMPDAALSSGFL